MIHSRKWLAILFLLGAIVAANRLVNSHRTEAADQTPAANSAAATLTASAGKLNLGKQPDKVQGELAGVSGYKLYASEVEGVGPNDWSMWGGSSIRNNT